MTSLYIAPASQSPLLLLLLPPPAGCVQQGGCMPHLRAEAGRLRGPLWLPAPGAACVPCGLLPQHGAAAAVHLQDLQQGAAAGGGAAALDQVRGGEFIDAADGAALQRSSAAAQPVCGASQQRNGRWSSWAAAVRLLGQAVRQVTAVQHVGWGAAAADQLQLLYAPYSHMQANLSCDVCVWMPHSLHPHTAAIVVPLVIHTCCALQ